MDKFTRISRIVQIVGALFLVAAIVSYSNHSTDMGWQGAAGLLLIIAARIYEFLTIK